MPARILVVDDIAANVKLLEAKLSAEYFDVVTAANGPEAIETCERGSCDLVLLDVMMPGLDGFEVCRRLKNSPATAHLPVVMVTALDQPSDRLRGLEAGADDFLTKPVDDTSLFARVRSLVRMKVMMDELRGRAAETRDYGLADPLAAAVSDSGNNARILVVDDRQSSCDRLAAALGQFHEIDLETDPQHALMRASEADYDLFLVSLDLHGFDGLRLCSQLRSLDRARHSAIIMMAEADAKSRILRGLDIGAHDFILRPVDRNELVARVKTQVKRKRFASRLRDSVQISMELAIKDGLTGLHNRRYLDSHLSVVFNEASRDGGPVSLLLLDIDRFKSINDRFGHDAGDEVLREFARRLRSLTRGIDIVARFGGEEMVVLIPDAPLSDARSVAERIRERIGAAPFAINRGEQTIPVTVSIGVAEIEKGDVSPADLLKRADIGLYRAKEEGRNRVVAAAA